MPGREEQGTLRPQRSVPVASMTASASAANSSSAYAGTPSGRSDFPFPRPSKVTTRAYRAR